MRKRIDEKLRGQLAIFVKQYSRKAQRGVEPNDRCYDRKMEKLMKSLTPEELSDLLNESEPKDE
jgi:hypothetical protein